MADVKELAKPDFVSRRHLNEHLGGSFRGDDSSAVKAAVPARRPHLARLAVSATGSYLNLSVRSRPISNGGSGSILLVRQAVQEEPLLAQCDHSWVQPEGRSRTESGREPIGRAPSVDSVADSAEESDGEPSP